MTSLSNRSALSMFRRSWSTAFTVTLLVAAATSCGSDGSPGVQSSSGGGGETLSAGPAADFVRFAESDLADGDAEYIAGGLRRLAGALGALNVGTPELGVDLRAAAEHVLLSPTSAATAAPVRTGLLSAARALAVAQDTGPGLESLAESIRPDVPLLDQMVRVREFFQACAQTVQSLSRRASA